MKEMRDTTTLYSESKGYSRISYFHILYKAKDIYVSSASSGNVWSHLHTMTRHFMLLCDSAPDEQLCGPHANSYFYTLCIACVLSLLPADTSIIPAFPVCWELFLPICLRETPTRTISDGSGFRFVHLSIRNYIMYAVAWLDEALCYKPEGSGFDSRWSHWIFQLT
jgi:hypothetical protein